MDTQLVRRTGLALAMVVALVFPALSLACACECGVFDVGTALMYASHAGGIVFLEYDFLDQHQNRSATSSAPAANNPDKEIRSSFMMIGAQYQFNRSWGMTVEVPDWQRYFQTTDALSGELASFSHGAASDIRIKGTYTGFSADMSSGVTVGVKLANGDSSYPNFDPDTEIGSGSTDVLVGGYHLGRLAMDNRWGYFLQGQWDQPLSHRENYRSGAEGVVVAGLYFEGWATQAR